MNRRPLIGITIGDPASIGPEITVRALSNAEIYDACRPLLIGDAQVVRRAMNVTGLHLPVRVVTEPDQGFYQHGSIDLIDLRNVEIGTLQWGKVQAQAGRAACEYVTAATRLALAGSIDAVATAPLNKEALMVAGIPHIGHTEILGDLTRRPDPLTMFETRGLRIFFLSRHISLLSACARVTRDRILDALRRSRLALLRLGIDRPRIAVAGLNPHAGENGRFGEEELREVEPAVADARAEGIDAYGPAAADSVFWHTARGRFDAALSLYHDQGHIAAKMYDFERTVSITNELPFLRTSVDHGTAFDIAGEGIASPVSMEEAIIVAARYAHTFRRG